MNYLLLGAVSRGQINKLINIIGNASTLNKHMLFSKVSKSETLEKQICNKQVTKFGKKINLKLLRTKILTSVLYIQMVYPRA